MKNALKIPSLGEFFQDIVIVYEKRLNQIFLVVFGHGTSGQNQ